MEAKWRGVEKCSMSRKQDAGNTWLNEPIEQAVEERVLYRVRSLSGASVKPSQMWRSVEGGAQCVVRVWYGF